MWERQKARAAKAVARLVSDYVSSDRLVQLWAKLQHVRTVVDEAEGAFWHFTAMPSRRDVRLILRRVASVRRRAAELERALAQLERAEAHRRGSGPDEATPPREGRG